MNRRKAIQLGIAGTAGILILPGQAKTEGDHKRNDKPKMKTIGIFGGFGPQATTDIEARIHSVSQRLIPQKQNSGYPPMIVFYQRHAPVLLKEDHTPVLPLQPDPRLLEAAARLGALVDFIIIPANTVHVFQKEIEQAAGCQLLSMIDLTLEEVKRRKWQKVGVLGFRKPVVYTNRLTEMNMPFETVDVDMGNKLDESIERVMEGRNDAEDGKVALAAIEALRARKVDGIIPGCTEIPLLLEKNADDADLVNPSQLLAEAAVRLALA